MKNILLISQHFYPEQFKCNDVAFELAKKGYNVTVLTGIPNYPKGKFFPSYGLIKRRKEVVNGVKIHRALLVPRGNGKGLRLALNYFSWAFFASLQVIWICLFHRFDAIVVHETSPITVGIPAVLAKKMQRIPMLFWVLDLWPESLTAAGGVTSPSVLKFFTRLTQWIYKHSSKILLSSRGFRNSICEKGPFGDKLEYFPNWAERTITSNRTYHLPEIPTGFCIMFAGNMGEAQDFEHIMECALQLKEEKQIHFLFVGDGRKRTWVETFIEKEKLEQTVHWLGRHPLESMPIFFEQANVMFVSLKNKHIFNLTAPAKFQSYMAAGKPIVAMLNGEGQRLIEESSCGLFVKAGDADALAKTLKRMTQMESKQLEQWGKNGRDFCAEHFNLEKSMNHLCRLLEHAK
ncbi:MAG: glycosyltransferase family 4 protein [Bacteroidaceae bacterium]